MTDIDNGADAPTVLVVEDEVELLRSRLRQLAARGVRAVGASTAEHAAAFVVSANGPLSLAIIDVNLRPDDPGDRSGLALARLLRASGMSMPVVGYSAHFEDGAISDRDRGAFQAWIDKGRLLPNQITDRYAELAQDVFAAANGSVMDRTTEAADAVVEFLAATSAGHGNDVVPSRAYLKSAIGARAYDPAYDPLNPSEDFDPLAHRPDGVPPLPHDVAAGLIVMKPEQEDDR
jgi:CheY-like chemotaxis protein